MELGHTCLSKFDYCRREEDYALQEGLILVIAKTGGPSSGGEYFFLKFDPIRRLAGFG